VSNIMTFTCADSAPTVFPYARFSKVGCKYRLRQIPFP
jgi:hypothetical protein